MGSFLGIISILCFSVWFAGASLTLVRRKAVLTSFYKSIVGSLFPPLVSPDAESGAKLPLTTCSSPSSLSGQEPRSYT